VTDAAATPASRPDISPQDLAASSVLVVDDNEQNLELIQAYLEELGCEIRAARDGVEALASVDSAPPDMILLDVMMPRMSGFQACARIKSNPQTRDIPVLMITALNEVGDVERAVESGADDFLTKPVNKLELLTRVRSLLRVRQLKKQLDRTLEEMRRLGRDDPGATPAPAR
jgi:two-component system alkaline phosphatase synthesis response regulator PhoP